MSSTKGTTDTAPKVKRDRKVAKDKNVGKKEELAREKKVKPVATKTSARSLDVVSEARGSRGEVKISASKKKEEIVDDDDLPPVDPDDLPSPEDEVIDMVAPSASAGLVIVKEKAKSEEKKAGSRKFLRVQQKIATKMEERQSVIEKQTANKRRAVRVRSKNESSVDVALRESSSLLEIARGVGSTTHGALVVAEEKKAEKPKPVKTTKIKIAGMVDGLTPMEIARQKKSGFDSLF